MEKLSKYTPAETMVLLYDFDAQLKDLLRVTFLDMLLKQVLQVVQVEHRAHEKDPLRVYEYIVAGKNFDHYIPYPHESVFTAIFRQDKSLRVFFRFMVKEALSRIRGHNNYVKMILFQSPVLRQFFKNNIYFQFLNIAKITPAGEAERDEIDGILTRLDAELPDLLENNKAKALEILKIIGGNVFLLQRVQFHKYAFPEMAEYAGSDIMFYTGNDLPIDSDTFDEFFEDIDDCIDSFESSFTSEASHSDGGSSCSSDSSCSGDGGGCGGGCGGD